MSAYYLIVLICLPSFVACNSPKIQPAAEIENHEKGVPMTEKVVKSNEEWKKMLTPEQYRVVREKGTEAPFTGEYNKFYEDGIYQCVACGLDLFSSKTKFDSGTGWPSFWEPISTHVQNEEDTSFFMKRTEVLCSRCGGHLGHVFDDGPKPTGLRYCINSLSLKFKKQ